LSDLSRKEVDPGNLSPHAYVVAVHDLTNEVTYYIEKLGFAVEWEDADRWCGLVRGHVRMMLGRCPETIPAADLGDHNYFAFLVTDDVDALHREFLERGAEILAVPADKPWGWREMPVRTPEGFRLMFAQAMR